MQAQAQENPDTLALDATPAPAVNEMQPQESADPSAPEPNLASATDQVESQESPDPSAPEANLASAAEQMEPQESADSSAAEAKAAPVLDQVQAQESRDPAAAEAKPAVAVDQIIYKGVVGNLLEGMAIDPDKRVQLQKTNAVVSNVVAGRTLAIRLGVANPVLMIGGLVWGIWSASQIKPAELATRALDSICIDKDVTEADAVNVVLVDAPGR